MQNTKNIRNFAIIAHIDHGKSTLADRLIQFCGGLSEREMKDQVLDSMDIERERGITIKAQTVRLNYKDSNSNEYQLNLIDTPGHVDFSYEVNRSLSACEGSILVVDAAQGVEAQTLANVYQAIDLNHEIIPVINKIDLPAAEPDRVCRQIEEVIGLDASDAIKVSAKTGEGIEDIIKGIIDRVPAPGGKLDSPLQALIFDSVFNPYRGIETYFKVINGKLSKGDRIRFMSTGKDYGVEEVGTLKLSQVPKKEVLNGDVGYLITGIKDAKDVKVGDTITLVGDKAVSAIEGFEEVKPMVFAGIYPVDTDDYEDLRSSMEKLQLNDASLVFSPESSAALGFGFRCGFLGMLHLEIIQERLQREFNMSVITTVPNVSYKAYVNKDPSKEIQVNNPSDLPDPSSLNRVEEPYIDATIITKSEFVGNVLTLCIEKRGEIKNQRYLTPERVELSFKLPLAEIVFDFYDRLKSVSKGYASFDYSPSGFVASKLVRLDILLNGKSVDALSSLIHADNAQRVGRKMCEKLRELIPRQQFDIPVQAAIGAKIISRETIKAYRKDVTAKLYGGDVTRKRKLLEKQKKGKKKMRMVGSVEIPQQAFMAVLKIND